MTTPKAVRDAASRAEALHAEAYGDNEENTTQPTTVEPEVPPSDTPSEEQAPPAPTPAPAPAQPKEESAEFWRNKFNTLEGKYRAEVPRLAQDLRASQQRLQQVEQTLANITASNNRDTPATKPLVTAEEVEEYGEDFVSMMRRLAQEEAGRVVQDVTPRIQEVEGQLQRERAQTQADRVYAMLDANVEDWRQVNRSPEFLEWLNEEDPYVGAPRAALLRDAFDRKDGPRVLTFFQSFITQRRLLSPPQQEPTPAPPVNGRVQPQVTLADLAGPRSSGSTTTPKPSGEEQVQPWTRRQIAAFYKDVQVGHYKNDPDKRDRIERSINRASQAGLVTP